MPRTLFAKLALGLALLLVVVGLSWMFISQVITERYFQTVNQQVSRELAANLVRDRALVYAGGIDQAAIAKLFHDYMDINPGIEVYLLDADGNIRAHAAEPGKVKRERVSLEPVREFLAAGARFPLFGDDPRDYMAQKLFSVAPLPSREHPQGYLYVILSGEQFDAIERDYRAGHVFRLGALAVAASLALGLAFGLIVFRLLTRRLRRLHAAVCRLRDEGPGTSIALPVIGGRGGGDELDELTATFAELSGTIQRQFEALADTDHRRRELVANVTHDLRTPLTALSGYLQTLRAQGDTLPAAQRREFIDTALRNSARLQRLVADLFELAKLEARELVPERRVFCLHALVREVLSDLAIEAGRRCVELVLTGGEGESFEVRADATLIERVLVNLVGNALEHTPAGGKVEITLRREPGFVVTRIADNGHGIAAPSLPLVFERHYRAAPSPDASPVTPHHETHAGLGLAISKRIMELHDARLNIESVLERGTTLEFRLPAAAPG